MYLDTKKSNTTHMLEIIEKDDQITSSGTCDIDLEKLELSKSYTTSSNWTNLDGTTSILRYNISFNVSGLGSADKLLHYTRKLHLRCVINNIDAEAIEVIDLKRKMNHELFSFIQDNCELLIEKLNLSPIVFSDQDIQIESNRMKSSLEATQLNSLNEEQRRVIDMTLPI